MSNQSNKVTNSSNVSSARDDVTSSKSAMSLIREKLESITQDYASGKLNAAQFNAMYAHYTEKRQIIEKLLERNPETDAWRNVVSQGNTHHLRARFAARPLYYVVFRRGEQSPLISGGRLSKKSAQQVHQLLKILWKMRRWSSAGLVRKSMGDGMWLLLATGQHSLTIAVFMMQPSEAQTTHVRDLQRDFEVANLTALEKGEPAESLVYPQRALLES
jgi:hypothetical protein